MSKKSIKTVSLDAETLNTNNEANANALQGTSTTEQVKAETPIQQIDLVAAGNKQTFETIQGIAVETLKQVFAALVTAFILRRDALKSILGDTFNEQEFWSNDEIANSICKGASQREDGFKTDGTRKYTNDALNSKIVALAKPFVVGLGIRKADDFVTILATRKGSHAELARDAYAYSKVLSSIPQMVRSGLLTNAQRTEAYTTVRKEFTNSVIADLAIKHLFESARGEKITMEQVKLVQDAIKAYNAAVKAAKDDKSIAEPAKLSWATIFQPKNVVQMPATTPVLPELPATNAQANSVAA